jgi:FAD/FMN-containing dehydrogenase
MPEFLPKLLAILHKAGIAANIAGHAGNGNYHIIPLMDIAKASERAKIVPVSKQVYDLIIEYGGSITAEHNDGIMRTPFVEQMFGAEMYQLFKQIKTIFDPQNIFNPGKKVGGTLEYLEQHLAKK